jgi:hypothetical protein
MSYSVMPRWQSKSGLKFRNRRISWCSGHSQSGQALTEFVIGAGFVMVPLFLLISIAGKNADIKYAALQSARYEAWEYTANYYEASQIESGFTALTSNELPIKSGLEVRKEARRRFFSETGVPLNSKLDKRGYRSQDANPLWRYHNGKSMVDPSISTLAAPSTLAPNDFTPDIPQFPVFTRLLNVLDTVLEAFASVLAFLGSDAGFTAIDSKGLAISKFAIKVADSPMYGLPDASNRAQLMPDLAGLQMRASASVLTTNWSAGGTDHTYNQTRGLVPTSVLDALLSPGGVDLRSLVTWLPPLYEFDSANLQFGKMMTDEAMHPSKIKENIATHQCDKGGSCDY